MDRLPGRAKDKEKKRNKARATQWKATQSGTSKETRTNKAECPYLSTTWDMHLGRWLGDAAATPHGGCSAPAHRLRVPRSPLRYFHPLPPPFALSLFLRPTTGFFLHLGSARQSVPGVCTHSAQRPPLGAPTLSHPAVRGQPTSWEQLRRIVLPRSIVTVEDLCGRSTILEVILRRWHGSSAQGGKCKRKKNGKLMHSIERDVNEETWRE